MPKHAKIVPISAGRLNSQQAHKEMIVPIQNGSSVQLSFSELLMRYFQEQKTAETGNGAETSRPKRRKIIYLPTRSADDSCSA